MELRLPLKLFKDDTTFRAVCGTCMFFGDARGRLVGFLELRRQCGVSHEVQWGAQGASHVVPGKSDLHRVARGSASFFSSHGRGIGHQDA